MPTNFPASADAYGDPTGTQVQGATTPTHSGHHQNHNDAIEALEAKLGTGAGVAAADTVLRGTGTGTTGFGKIVSADITADAISQSGAATPTGSQTTTSTSLVTMAGSSIPLTTTGGLVVVIATLTVYNSNAGGYVVLFAALDGTPVGPGMVASSVTATAWVPVTIAFIMTPSAGPHTFTIQWYVGGPGSTGTLQGGEYSVVEIKR